MIIIHTLYIYKNVPMSVTKTMRYRDVPKVFGHCDFLLYISCKTTFFLKTLFQSRLLFDFDDLFTNKNRIKCSFTL